MDRWYQFHAHASGFAAQFTHPFTETIEVKAPAALPPMGGYSSGRIEHFRFKEILSFRAAYTQVSGGYSHETRSWDTIMTATVEKLEILGVVQAEMLVARLASRHPVDGDEPSIIPLGSQIQGLRIVGVPVEIEFHTGLYCKYDTHSKLRKAYRDDSAFREEFDRLNHVGRHEELDERHRFYFPWSRHKPGEAIREVRGKILTSIVRDVRCDNDAIERRGNVIYVPQFGSIILGQLLIDDQARRLTMLQVDLGCATCGKAACASGETNGSPMPPPQHPL